MIIFKELNGEIYRFGSSNVSKHCGDLSKMNVLDISPTNGGITNPRGMANELKNDSRVDKVLSPYYNSGEKAIHVEIKQE